MSNETRMISLALQTPGCLPLLIWGEPGEGKTSVVCEVAEALGYDAGPWSSKPDLGQLEDYETEGLEKDLEVLRPAERGEGSMGTVPVPSENRRVLCYPIPEWADRLIARKKGMLLLDELSSCPPALQPAVSGLLLDGIISGKKLPRWIKRIGIANPVDQAAGGWEMSLAMSNRAVHIEWSSPRVDEWSAWLNGQTTKVQICALDPEAWQKEWGCAKALGMAFMRSHPSSLSEQASKVMGRFPAAMAKPRTWEAALRLLASCRAANAMDLYPALAQGALGPSVAMTNGQGAWLIWLQENDLPDPEDLLKDADLFSHDPKRPDRTFATLLAVAEAGLATVNGKKLSAEKRGERWEQAWRVMDRALGMKLGKDVVLMPSYILAGDRKPKCKIEKYAVRVCTVLKDFIRIFDPN